MINLDTFSLYEIIKQEYLSELNNSGEEIPQKLIDDTQFFAEEIIRRVNTAAAPPRPQCKLYVERSTLLINSWSH